jgi:hypothetical protein
VSRGVVIDFEKGRRTPGTNNLAAIRRALESAGVEFIAENGGGVGLRLRKRAPSEAEPKKAGARQTVDEVLGLLSKVRRSSETE